MFIKLLFLCLFCSANLSALLAPFEQSVKELEAVLTAPQLRNIFKTDETIKMVFHEKNIYIVSTDQQYIEVAIQYLEEDATSSIGPKKFHLAFSDPVPLHGN